MKKKGLFAALLLGFGGFSAAQAQFSFGFKISPNFAWAKIQDGAMENNGLGLGFSYGLTGDYQLGSVGNYFLSTDILITSAPVKLQQMGNLVNQKAGSLNADTFTNVQFDYTVQMLQIPIMVKFKTDEIGGMKYFFQAGLAPSFLTSARLKTTADPNLYEGTNLTSHNPNSTSNGNFDFNGGNNTNANLDYMDDVSAFRMSLIWAAGIEYPLSERLRLVGALKFDNGFTDMLKDDKYSGRHNFLSFQVGLMF